jgi:hypothetical protein
MGCERSSAVGDKKYVQNFGGETDWTLTQSMKNKDFLYALQLIPIYEF